MSISLIDLPYLIELVSIDIKNLEATINNPYTPDGTRDSCGELLIAASRTAVNLQSLYQQEWKAGNNLPRHEDLIKEIQESGAAYGK